MPGVRFVLLAILGITSATSVFADTFNLTIPNDTCSPCAPAGTVQVDVELLTTGAGTSTATVTFTAQTVGGNLWSIYVALFQANGSFGISKYIVTGGSAAGTVTAPAVTSGQLDLYGTFSETSEVVHDASQVEFFLDNGTWTSAANVLTTTPLPNGNAGGYAQPFDAAAQVRVHDCTSSTQPGCTGNTGSPGTQIDSAGFETTSVPEPTSVILLSSVLLLVAFINRKKLVA